MRSRRLGQFGIVATLLMLGGNLWMNLRAPDRETGTRPEGFPWPSDGLGEITIGVEGSFEINLEERVLSDDDTAQRVPNMTVIGRDPRPKRSGMGISDAQITSYSYEQPANEQTLILSKPQVVVNAPTAWAPMVQSQGVSTLDRSRPWKFTEPVLTFPGMAAGKDFVLEARNAQLNPRNNVVHCQGRFVLHSPGLRIVGFGLRLDPQKGELHFGESDGRLDWEMKLPQGGKLRGHADGGGSFRSLNDESLVLRLNAKQQCYLTLPPTTEMPGRLETMGMTIFLRAAGDGWQPERLEGDVTTHWTGQETILSGGPSDASWDALGRIQNLLIDGPVMGSNLGTQAGWLTAAGGAHLDGPSGELYLWNKVNVFRPESQLRAGWARINQNQKIEAGGGVLTLNSQGMAMGQKLQSMPDGNTLAVGNVLVFPASPELDVLQAPTLILGEKGSLEAPESFSLRGTDGETNWILSGQNLQAQRTPGTLVVHAQGSIRCQHDDTVVLGDEVQIRGKNRIVVTGRPTVATIPIDEGVVIARARRCLLIGEQIHLLGNPSFDLPAAALGLRGGRVLIEADTIRRDSAGVWHLTHALTFSGAITGTAQSASWVPGGRLTLHSRPTDDALAATLEDGSLIRGRADRMEAHPNGPLDLTGNIDMRHTPVDGVERHLTGQRAHLEKDSGWLSGDAHIRDGLVDARAKRAWWTASENGEVVLHLDGAAKFSHARGNGRADRIDYFPDQNRLELHRSPRRQAWLKTEDGRKIEADWIEVDLLQFLISSRNGAVRKGGVEQ